VIVTAGATFKTASKHIAGQPQADSVRDETASATMDVEPSPDFYRTRSAMMAVPVE
jgi:hypothetical protein